MATYKVIQDIEAEDKLVGPLTLRQFIYAGISAVCIYLSFIMVTKGIPWGMIFTLPVILTFGFLAFPWGRDQPTEIWAVAKIQFLFKPRRRIWDQSGAKELVTVTVPKRVEHAYTDGLSQTEVRSRLRALADTIDSRGWAIKNVDVNMYGQQSALMGMSSDRLIDLRSIPQDVPNYDIHASDDILDESSSRVAQQFSQMIASAENKHRSSILSKLKNTTAAAPAPSQPVTDFWFLNGQAPSTSTQKGYATFQNNPVVVPGTEPASTTPDPTPSEEALLEELEKQGESIEANRAHLKTILPLSEQQQKKASKTKRSKPKQPEDQTTSTMTQKADAAILELARSNDLSVATLAREAKRAQGSDDEVVISLR